MNVVIPYQNKYSIPMKCCVCGAVNPISKFQIQSKEVRQFATTASVSLTLLICQSCIDELKTIKKTEKPVMLIGLAIGFLVGFGIGTVIFLTSGDANPLHKDFINEFLGPICAVGGIFGLIGSLIAKVIWNIKLDSTTRQRIKDLESPARILDFGFQTGFIGNVKSAVVKINFYNDTFGQEFMVLNNFQLD